MRAEDLPLAVLALLTIVVAVPPWLNATGSTDLGIQTSVMVGLALPAMLSLFVASWVRPSLVQPFLGGFVLIGIILLVPQLWALTGMAASRIGGGVAQTVIQVALPVLLIMYAAGLGWRRSRA